VTLRVGAATVRHLLADCWQTTLRAGAGDAKCLVELRGFEPLTPCMPLASQPLTTQLAPTPNLPSALVSREMASKRCGANCGDARLGCWRIAGRIAQHHRPRDRTGSTSGALLSSEGWVERRAEPWRSSGTHDDVEVASGEYKAYPYVLDVHARNASAEAGPGQGRVAIASEYGGCTCMTCAHPCHLVDRSPYAWGAPTR